MSEAQTGHGWWRATDGRWYPTGVAPGWRQATDGQWYPPEVAPGWRQATDGRWYPPEAVPSWQQAADGQWYPSGAAPGDPATEPTPTVDHRPELGPSSGRTSLVPAGDPPPADDVAAAGTEVGDRVKDRATMVAVRERSDAALAQLRRAEHGHGTDPGVFAEVAVADANAFAEGTRALQELDTGAAALSQLEHQRLAAARAAELAERGAKALKVKAVIAGVVLVVVLLLIYFLAT